jgi:hypothetical protein
MPSQSSEDSGRNPAVFTHYYESPSDDPAAEEIWCYCDRPCYSPGETVCFHVSSSARSYSLEIARDGLELEVVFTRSGLSGERYATPGDASVAGCGWPSGFEFEIPVDWPSGGYRVTCRIDTADGVLEQHALFLLRSSKAGRRERLLLVSATGTWCAYNNWGGSNHYEGISGPQANLYSPILSLERPLARGFVVLPPQAPRAALAAPPEFGEPVSYPHMDWAYATGHSKKYASAGWASYERHFLRWALRAGFDVDIVSQYDLQLRPEATTSTGPGKCAIAWTVMSKMVAGSRALPATSCGRHGSRTTAAARFVISTARGMKIRNAIATGLPPAGKRARSGGRVRSPSG